MSRHIRQEIRICLKGDCRELFECRQDSPRRYCQKHTSGMGLSERHLHDDPMLPVEPTATKAEEFEKLATQFLATHLPLPPVPDRIKATRVEDMGFNTPQEMVSLFSDLHYGSRIDRRVAAGLAEYNIDIARDRLARWRNGQLRFAQQDQHLLTIDTLHLFAIGDDIEGHGAMFGTQALTMQESMGFQVLGFVDDVSVILPELLSRYKKIRVYKVHGNHGRIAARAKDAYPPDNAELFAWQMIAERMKGLTGGEWSTTENGIRCLQGGDIEFFISPSELLFIDVLGWNFAVRHGHGLRNLMTTYTGIQDNKYRLNSIVGEIINYYIFAHHHFPQNVEAEIRGETIGNGCFVGPSLLSVMMSRAAANLPSQELFTVHPRHGITNRHRIHLAEVEEVRRPEFIGRV